MKLNINELKKLTNKLNMAIEKSKLNPKSGWIELDANTEGICFKVSNYDYYMEAYISAESYVDESNTFNATVLAETFIPLVSKLDVETIDIYEKLNALIIDTNTSSYTFPIIKELGITKKLDTIDFNATTNSFTVDSNILTSIADTNAKGLIDSIYSSDIQQYIYVDKNGAITFTENMYVNDFKIDTNNVNFKILLTATQAKLLEIFKNEKDITITLEQLPTYEEEQTVTNKVKISNNSITLILITKPESYVARFPSIKLRALAENDGQTYITIDKKQLDKALARLMVFDKKFDITVMDYSKIVFHENELELISVKNKNFEKIQYISSQNAIEHESIIRFADLIKQLKAITSKELNISYGSRPAIVINSEIKQIIPEIRLKGKV